MIFYYWEGRTLQKQKNICAAYGSSSTSVGTLRKNVSRFRLRHFVLVEWDHSARHAFVYDDQVKTLNKLNPFHTTRDITKAISISDITVG